MQLLIKGKNVEVNDSVRAHVEKKMSRLDRYLDNVTLAEVELSKESTRSASDRFVVQVTMDANGTILRGEEKAADPFAAVDAVLDVLQRRLTRYKEKLYQRGRNGAAKAAIAEELAATGEPLAGGPAAGQRSERAEPQLVRTKRVSIKPMTVLEAAEQMELLGHDFFLFYNAESDRTSVVYRRRDGDYGLLEPEVEGA